MSTSYVTAEHIPPELRLISPTGVQHIRSRFTRHWDGKGTPMCNDGKQLPLAPPDIAHGYLCKRCNQLHAKEVGG